MAFGTGQKPQGHLGINSGPGSFNSTDGGIKRWEVRLALSHAAALIGIVTGSLVCAFYLGLASGQRAGFEGAQAALLANVAKFPIPDEYRDRSNTQPEEFANDVYAQLGDPSILEDAQPAGDLPTIAKVKEAELLKGEASVKEPSQFKDNVDLIEQESRAELTVKDTGQKIIANPSDLNVGSLSKDSDTLITDTETSPTNSAITVLGSKGKATTLGSIKGSNSVVPSLNQTTEHSEVSREMKSEIKQVAKLDSSPKIDSFALESVKKQEPTQNTNSFVREVLPKGWFAQVAAPRQLKDADQLARKLKENGFPVVIEKADVKGEQYHRILVGPEENRNLAQALIGQLKSESYLRGEPFLRVVK